jgi:hypothetical protein
MPTVSPLVGSSCSLLMRTQGRSMSEVIRDGSIGGLEGAKRRAQARKNGPRRRACVAEQVAPVDVTRYAGAAYYTSRKPRTRAASAAASVKDEVARHRTERQSSSPGWTTPTHPSSELPHAGPEGRGRLGGVKFRLLAPLIAQLLCRPRRCWSVLPLY